MRRTPWCFILVAVSVFCIASADLCAGLITFGSGSNTFDLEFVPIGNPGNPADTVGGPGNPGSVNYSYLIAKYEIPRDAVEKASALGGLGITMHPMGFVGARPMMPATGIDWFEAARFVNWLNEEKGFSPAYKFDHGVFTTWSPSDPGYDSANPYRNANANFVLPTVDEWFKAAYYDPNTNQYYKYPTGSNSAPTPTSGGTDPGTAVYNQSFKQGPADVNNAGGLSPYGVMGLGGNVFEWNETDFDLINDLSSPQARLLRGDTWYALKATDQMNSSAFTSQDPAVGYVTTGFRVVSLQMAQNSAVPEPSSYLIWLLGCLGLWWVCSRRRLSPSQIAS